MTAGDQSRINKIRTAGFLTEDFTYDGEGRVWEYTQKVDYRTNYPWVTTYDYDTLGRVTGVHYPAQYGPSGGSRKVIENTYDIASRLTGLKVDGQDAASNIIYNASDQTTSIKIGVNGTNQITENYTFDSQTGLLTSQNAVKNGSNLLDLSYDYTRNNSAGNTNVNWKTGALTKILDNGDHNKDREFQFDALGRLTAAKGKATNQWEQQYVYDRYGNRTSVTATGYTANNSAVTRDGFASPVQTLFRKSTRAA
jgi:YD repeat-containing protein